jgi:hypothetical protein
MRTVVSRSLRVAFTVAMIAVMVLSPSAAAAAGDSNVARCGANTEASEGFRAYLPDCRAYELVTPPYKEGGVVIESEWAAVSQDGTRVIAGSGGAFAGAGNYWLEGSRNPSYDAYEFTRTSSGWGTAVLTPPATVFPHSMLMAASAEDFGTTLWATAKNTRLFNEDIYVRNASGKLFLLGPGTGPEVMGEQLFKSKEELQLAGASGDLTHSVFSIEASASVKEHNGHSNLWPGDTTLPEAPSLYEYVYAGEPDGEPTLVGVKNQTALKNNSEAQLISNCGTVLGSGATGSAYNAVSGNGKTVFFTALHSRPSNNLRECATPSVDEVYARIDGSRTVSLSEPTTEDCEACNTTTERKNATFVGASQDGEKIFFMTEQPLLAGHEGTNLYEYDFSASPSTSERPTGKISLVSGGSQNAGVQGVVRVSADGSHMYFVAEGVLTGANAEGQAPIAGADNLYVRDTVHERTAFVATLLTSSEEAALLTEEEEEQAKVREIAEHAATTALEEALAHGASFLEAIQIHSEVQAKQEQMLPGTLGPGGTLAEDRSVWQSRDARPAQATPDGQHLVFLSSAKLTANDESRHVPQLFEYDAGEESLTRVSIGQARLYNHNGNVAVFHDAPQIPVQSFNGADLPTTPMFHLAVSADGGRVFFTSAAGLTPQAKSGSSSVYEYREGNVYLVSDGLDSSETAGMPTVQLFGTDPSGSDALFLSADPLVPQDGATQVALYDAREEGGFLAPLIAAECEGEACRGPSGATPQLQPAGSANQAGGDNLAPPASKPIVKPKPLTRAQKRDKALKACRAKRNKTKRVACEAQARRKYGTKSKSKAATSNRGHRKAGR